MTFAEDQVIATFNVGARVRSIYGGSRLVVGPGRLELVKYEGRVGGLMSVGPLTHRGEDVTMVYVRFVPPNMNTSVVLVDGNETGFAVVPLWERRRLRDALVAAGFSLNEVQTRFSRSGDGATPVVSPERDGMDRLLTLLAVGVIPSAVLAAFLLRHEPLLAVGAVVGFIVYSGWLMRQRYK